MFSWVIQLMNEPNLLFFYLEKVVVAVMGQELWTKIPYNMSMTRVDYIKERNKKEISQKFPFALL